MGATGHHWDDHWRAGYQGLPSRDSHSWDEDKSALRYLSDGGVGWSEASAGPSNIQHDKQPQEPKQHQLIEKQMWHHGKTPSLDGETGDFT
jgi:hypothetical protein